MTSYSLKSSDWSICILTTNGKISLERIKKNFLVKQQKFLLEKGKKLASIIAFLCTVIQKIRFFRFLVEKTDFLKKKFLKGKN